MKIIRAKDIQISSNPELDAKRSARESVKSLINIDDQYVQYVKAERDEDLLPSEINPFVHAVHLAYSQHLPLIISPDMIWYLISSGVAAHINANAENLRSKFVDHQGKKVIKVRRDDFVLGNLKNPWNEVIDEFCVQIGELTKNEVADTIQANFSTTTKDARVVSQIVLMDAMQKYFDYRFYTMCGVPEIRVSGTRDDWVNVSTKTKKLVSIIPELQKWLNAGLNQILENFVNIFDDRIDKEFWNSIYKIGDASGGPYISGWIIALFPYLKDGNQNHYIWGESTWKDSLRNDPFAGITTNSFDYHMNQVPFTWVYYDQEIKMLFVGGLIGVSVAASDKALAPVFGYAVTENKIKNDEKPSQ